MVEFDLSHGANIRIVNGRRLHVLSQDHQELRRSLACLVGFVGQRCENRAANQDYGIAEEILTLDMQDRMAWSRIRRLRQEGASGLRYCFQEFA
jgi:hypothetical protein